MQSGIATHYCESSRLPSLEHALCNLDNANNVEDVLNDFCPKIQLETALSKNLDQITECFDADSVEEIFSKLKKDGSDWAKKTTKVIRDFDMIFFNSLVFEASKCIPCAYTHLLNKMCNVHCTSNYIYKSNSRCYAHFIRKFLIISRLCVLLLQ